MNLHQDNSMRKASKAPCFLLSRRGWSYIDSAR
jgi:hypothetical protein